jgi:hypothetical protein
LKKILLVIFLSSATFASAAIKYKRSDWSKKWDDVDKDCQNARHELLIAQSLIPVVLNKKGCSVISGKWNDYFYPEILTQASQVQIDHLVPLKLAHLDGAAGWSKEQKKAFYHAPENLVITNGKYNGQKGDRGLSKWLPANKEYACKYSRDFLKIKKKYQLTIHPEELNAVTGCPEK